MKGIKSKLIFKTGQDKALANIPRCSQPKIRLLTNPNYSIEGTPQFSNATCNNNR